MKSTFSGFYSINEDTLENIWKSNSTLFVFDTNCLLNLYRCEDQTRKDILGVMREVASRTWLPFQVGFEYQRNRRTVIEESVNSLIQIQRELGDIYKKNILSSAKIKKHLYNSLSDEIVKLQGEIKESIDNYIKDKLSPRIESKKSISAHDSIRHEIDSMIMDRVGSPPSQERIDEIDKEGAKRYDIKQPPGYKDNNKTGKSYFSNREFQDKFGDLYLWKELIEKAKSDEIKNVIFICDDQKEDWYYELSGKTHGVLESLKTEICNESKIENFKLINQLTFLHEAKSYLKNISISESSFKEVEELSQVEHKHQVSHKQALGNSHEHTHTHSFYVSSHGDNLAPYDNETPSEDNFFKRAREHSALLKTAKQNLLKYKAVRLNALRAIKMLNEKLDSLDNYVGVSTYKAIADELEGDMFEINNIIEPEIQNISRIRIYQNLDILAELKHLNKKLDNIIDSMELNIMVLDAYLEGL